jgi:hypothetical protein
MRETGLGNLAASPVFTVCSLGNGSCIISGSVVAFYNAPWMEWVFKLKWGIGGSYVAYLNPTQTTGHKNLHTAFSKK